MNVKGTPAALNPQPGIPSQKPRIGGAFFVGFLGLSGPFGVRRYRQTGQEMHN
jgi:hypothetical protein